MEIQIFEVIAILLFSPSPRPAETVVNLGTSVDNASGASSAEGDRQNTQGGLATALLR